MSKEPLTKSLENAKSHTPGKKINFHSMSNIKWNNLNFVMENFIIIFHCSFQSETKRTNKMTKVSQNFKTIVPFIFHLPTCSLFQISYIYMWSLHSILRGSHYNSSEAIKNFFFIFITRVSLLGKFSLEKKKKRGKFPPWGGGLAKIGSFSHFFYFFSFMS